MKKLIKLIALPVCLLLAVTVLVACVSGGGSAEKTEYDEWPTEVFAEVFTDFEFPALAGGTKYIVVNKAKSTDKCVIMLIVTGDVNINAYGGGMSSPLSNIGMFWNSTVNAYLKTSYTSGRTASFQYIKMADGTLVLVYSTYPNPTV